VFNYIKEAYCKKFLHRIAISALCGVLAGAAASVFLILLNGATNARIEHQGLIFLLPLAGLFIGWIYHAYGKDIATGNNLILEEIHDPKKQFHCAWHPLLTVCTEGANFAKTGGSLRCKTPGSLPAKGVGP